MNAGMRSTPPGGGHTADSETRKALLETLPIHGGTCDGTDVDPSPFHHSGGKNPCIRCRVLLAVDPALARLEAAANRTASLEAYANSQDWHTEWYEPLKRRAEAAEAERDAALAALREIAGMADPSADRNDDLIYGAQAARVARAVLGGPQQGDTK